MTDIIVPTKYQPPIVTHVHMYRSGICDDGPLCGSITFKGKLGKVELNLSDESCGKILALLADAAAESVAEVSNALRQQFTEATLTKGTP